MPGCTQSCEKRQLRDSRPLCRLRSQKFRKLFESIFSAPLVSRIRRVAQRQNISEGEAKATVQKMKNCVQITIAITPDVCGMQPETLISA